MFLHISMQTVFAAFTKVTFHLLYSSITLPNRRFRLALIQNFKTLLHEACCVQPTLCSFYSRIKSAKFRFTTGAALNNARLVPAFLFLIRDYVILSIAIKRFKSTV